MNEKPKSLTEVLEPRARLIAEIIANRIDKDNLWTGYTKTEPLEGELRETPSGEKFVQYWRKVTPEYPRAVISFDNINLKDVVSVKVGEKIVTRNELGGQTENNDEREERFEGKVVVPEGVEYKQDISHTFQKTTSLSEAVKLGAEAAVKATVKAEYEGIGGSLELAAKITAEYDKTMGEGETVSDTITRTLDFTKPGTYTYEAVRTIEDFEREITATTNFDHGVHFLDERAEDGSERRDEPRFIDYGWRSLEDFLAVAQGLAPNNEAMYHAFQAHRANEEEVGEIKHNGYGTVSYIAHYNSVKHQDITIKKEGEDNK